MDTAPMTCQEKVEREAESEGIVPTWLFTLRVYFKAYFSHPAPTHSSSCIGCSKVQEEPARVSNIALAEFAACSYARHFRPFT